MFNNSPKNDGKKVQLIQNISIDNSAKSEDNNADDVKSS